MSVKQILYFLFIAVLLSFSACKKKSVIPKPEASAATPVSISFPNALFTETEKVAVGAASTVIMDRLISLVNATPENAAIHISIFLFEYPGLVNALKEANKRGVNLHLLIDMSRDESIKQNPPVVNELRNALKDKAEIVLVYNDASSIAINHNKFALFSEVTTTEGSARNVVFQTSHNFTVADSRKIQDALTLSHAGLYSAFVTYWQDMRDKATRGMKDYFYREYNDPASGIAAHFLPKRRNGAAYGDDSTIELLNGISDPATAIIRVGMSDWTDTRLNVAQKLGELLDQGARVEVVVKSSIGENVLAELRELEKRGAFLKVYNMTLNTQQKVNIHAKFVLIDGTWKGAKSTVLVTGSHNFTQNALRNNNEVILLLQNSPLFSTYVSTFNKLKTIPGI